MLTPINKIICPHQIKPRGIEIKAQSAPKENHIETKLVESNSAIAPAKIKTLHKTIKTIDKVCIKNLFAQDIL